MSENFMKCVEDELRKSEQNVSITENGAIGYKTAGSKLVNMNFMLSSMRNMDASEIWSKYLDAYNENPLLAMIWLFFARDVRGGCGERRTFRIIFERLCRENPVSATKLLRLIPFYGRWDDVIEVVFGDVPCKVRDEAVDMLRRQIQADILAANTVGSISLLAKWLPSLYTSSKETCRRAEFLREAFGWAPKQYRTNLSGLRKRIKVVEQQMSANKWGDINYEAVPSRAAMNYRGAFAKHDGPRYEEYLTNVKDGKAQIHSGTLYPYDIVHAYDSFWKYDETLEEQWKALPDKVVDGNSTLVVVDGSGSMCTLIGNTKISCHDVANSLGIYFAEKLTGPYHNSFITFSKNPKFVHFTDGMSLYGKLDIMHRCTECSNTDIEKTFDLILAAAVNNNLSQDDLPKNVLIISDMEFDKVKGGEWPYYNEMSDTLFDDIRYRWEAAGYRLPRLMFWNVDSRTGTIPLTTNELGVALVSGFSPNVADMVMSGKLDPYSVLVDKLMSDRYQQARDALKE